MNRIKNNNNKLIMKYIFTQILFFKTAIIQKDR